MAETDGPDVRIAEKTDTLVAKHPNCFANEVAVPVAQESNAQAMDAVARVGREPGVSVPTGPAVPVAKESDVLKERTRRFAIRIIRMYRALPHSEEGRIIGKQLLRSGTSIGANYRAACRARSRAEFVAKLGIVLEEADETAFWLDLLRDAEVFPDAKLHGMICEADELISIFVASMSTAKRFTSAI